MAIKEDIEKAIEDLVARGEEPSVRKVWAELGNLHSFTTIGPVLKAWKNAQAAKSAPGSPIPEVLTDSAIALVAKCWNLAERKAFDDAQDARRGADQRIETLERKIDGLEDSLEEAEFLVAKEQHEKADLLRKLTASETRAIDLRGKIAGSAREITLLRERIAALSGRPARNKSERASTSQKRPATTNGLGAETGAE